MEKQSPQLSEQPSSEQSPDQPPASSPETEASQDRPHRPLTPGLTLAGTPIGNLADASPRLKAALQEADLLAVEDSRTLRKLAAGLGVQTRGRVLVNHDHNEKERVSQILQAVQEGQKVLLMSDAGMPAVSDPGYLAAAAVAQANLPLTAIPGPSAVTTAIALSGLPSGRFTFEGFLARKGSDRKRRLAALAQEERTMVFYESPHRLASTLEDFAQTFGPDRPAAVCREMTKLHEEVARGSLQELLAWAQSKTIKGEIAIVLQGAEAPQTQDPQDLTDLVLELVEGGLKLKEACAQVAQAQGVSKRDLYQAVLARRQTES